MTTADSILPDQARREQRRRLWRQWIALDAPQANDRGRTQTSVARPEAAFPIRISGAARPLRIAWLGAAVGREAEGAAEALAHATNAELRDGTLAWDARQRLTRLGTRLGLSRFDASLVIAAVQHRAPRAVVPAPSASRRSSSNTSVAVAVGAIVALELLCAAVWFWL